MLKQFYLICIVILFLNNGTNLYGSTTSSKFFYAKKNYITSILHNNKQKQIKYLKQIVQYGTKLNKNITQYKYELYRLDKSTKLHITKQKSIKSKYSISSVYTNKNTIVVNFNKHIYKSYVRFSKEKAGYFKYIFSIKGNFKDASPTKLSINGVYKIKIFQAKTNLLKIVLLNKTDIKPVYHIGKRQLIITVYPKKQDIKKNLYNLREIKIKKTEQKTNVFNVNYKNKIIVIDAGHGGKDSGALGPHHRMEKYVVLNIAKYLYKSLKNRGFTVYLTRDRDKFISLRYRTKFANKKNADIFISIHANAARKARIKVAKGVETYFLSPARSNRAKRVAALENKGDIHSMSYSSKNILLTLLNRTKITASQKIAIDVQSHILYNLRKIYGDKIIDAGVREGPFWVLVGAQMPSILVEVGYISHPEESKRLYTKLYQQKVANGIANGVVSYFAKSMK